MVVTELPGITAVMAQTVLPSWDAGDVKLAM